ncbi:MAG TPA: energy transducer TonB [Chitinophagaceae bacterium]|nr:energy transducer TonB [Chitinophagaceae bacterium]
MTQTLPFKRCLLILTLLLSFQQTFSQLVPTIREHQKDTDNEVFTKVDVPASFPGGNKAWVKYVSAAFDSTDFNTWEYRDQGTCRVRFIVDKKGNISEVHAINMKGTRLAKLAEEIITNGPQWKPALRKGRPVNAYREQPITVTLMNTLPQ